jgi:hypothetical protein
MTTWCKAQEQRAASERQCHCLCLLYALANVPIAEQELAAQVALFNDVVIRDGHTSFATSGHAHAGEVLDKLAAQSTSANQKQLQALQLTLHICAKDCYLAIVACTLEHQARCQGLHRQKVDQYEMKPVHSLQTACLSRTSLRSELFKGWQ